jgi:membrane protein required for colicin V production
MLPAYDLLMLLVLVSMTLLGAIKGFAWQVASLASVVVSYYFAYTYRNEVAAKINAEPPWNIFLAMLLIYAGTSLAIWLGFRLFSGVLDQIRLREFDRQMGAMLGLAKGAIYCLLVTFFGMTLLPVERQRAICQSRSGRYISQILAKSDGIFPAEVERVVRPHLERLENQLQQGGSGVLPADQGGNPSGNPWFTPAVPSPSEGTWPSFQSNPNGNVPSGSLLPGMGTNQASPGWGIDDNRTVPASGYGAPADRTPPTFGTPNTNSGIRLTPIQR